MLKGKRKNQVKESDNWYVFFHAEATDSLYLYIVAVSACRTHFLLQEQIEEQHLRLCADEGWPPEVVYTVLRGPSNEESVVVATRHHHISTNCAGCGISLPACGPYVVSPLDSTRVCEQCFADAESQQLDEFNRSGH